MKNLFLIGAAVVLGATLHVSAAKAERALTASMEACAGFDANGTMHAFPVTQQNTTVTNSKKGISRITCTGRLPDGVPLPSRAMKWNWDNAGAWCNAAYGVGEAYTKDWQATTAPNGQVSLTCLYKE